MVTFRALNEADFDLLADWLGRAHVQEWWRDPEAPSLVWAKYGPRVRGEVPTEVFIVEFEGTDVGIIQRYRIDDHPEWSLSLEHVVGDLPGAAGIDYLIGDDRVIGKGVGTEMIRDFTDKLFADLEDVVHIAVTPQVANVASCRVLERAGYERRWVGRLDSDDPSDAGDAALYVRSRSLRGSGSGPTIGVVEGDEQEVADPKHTEGGSDQQRQHGPGHLAADH